MVGAITCGNCAIVKPSNQAPATSSVIKKIIENTFDQAYIAVIEGGKEANQSLLENKFDLIFFAGSKDVGKIVMGKAAQNLTPVVLELGGKSPCIIDKTADIKMAGKRIAWGKGINAGQICVAPDYLLVHKDVKIDLINELKKNMEIFFDLCRNSFSIHLFFINYYSFFSTVNPIYFRFKILFTLHIVPQYSTII